MKYDYNLHLSALCLNAVLRKSFIVAIVYAFSDERNHVRSAEEVVSHALHLVQALEISNSIFLQDILS